MKSGTFEIKDANRTLPIKFTVTGPATDVSVLCAGTTRRDTKQTNVKSTRRPHKKQ